MSSTSSLNALHFLLLLFSGWVNRHQLKVIDYLLDENRVLREQLGGRRLRLNDDQRRRLAVKGKALGRKVLREVAGIVTPDTILRWYGKLVANSYAERFVLSAKSECLGRMVPLGENHLRRAMSAFVSHYHRERGRGLTTPPIAVESMLSATTGRLRCDRGSASARIWAAQIPSEGPPPSVRRLFGAEF